MTALVGPLPTYTINNNAHLHVDTITFSNNGPAASLFSNNGTAADLQATIVSTGIGLTPKTKTISSNAISVEMDNTTRKIQRLQDERTRYGEIGYLPFGAAWISFYSDRCINTFSFLEQQGILSGLSPGGQRHVKISTDINGITLIKIADFS